MRPHGAGSGCCRLLVVAGFFWWTALVSGFAADAAAAEPAPAPGPENAAPTAAEEKSPGTTAATEEPPVPDVARSVADLYRQFSPAVVRVKLISEELDQDGKNIVWYVSGFFINREGRVLTGLLSSTRVQRVVVEKDGLDYGADFLGGDLRTNLGLVQVLKTPEDITVIPVEPRPQLLPTGSPVLALTQPLELNVSPSPGYITGYESGFAQYIFPFSYQRANIPLGPGEVGAPVLDESGRLAGVMVAAVPELRASYYVPPTPLRRIIGDLAEKGRVDYGRLPLEFAEGPNALFTARQIVVTKVEPGSSADRAGVRVGDVLRDLEVVASRVEPYMAEREGFQAGDVLPKVGPRPFRRIADVRDTLFNARPGDYVRIELEREGRIIPFFTLPVEAMPGTNAPPPAARESSPTPADPATR